MMKQITLLFQVICILSPTSLAFLPLPRVNSHRSPSPTFAPTCLRGVTPKPWGDGIPIREDIDADIESENIAPINEPTWKEMFPLSSKHHRPSKAIKRDYPDFASLQPDDPLFLDMAWPTQAGPEASAFARHMQWRRGLSDGERLRWQKWAIYARLLSAQTLSHHFQHTAADYVMQNLQKDAFNKALRYAASGKLTESSAWGAIGYGFVHDEIEEARTVVQSYYSALNRNNFDQIKTLLLPDVETCAVFPGYEKVVGFGNVEK